MAENKTYAAIDQKTADAHWKENSSLVGLLLAVWFVVTWLAAILANSLNKIRIFGFPLGYTMGSLIALLVYTAMIFYYAFRMDQIDEKYGMKE